MLAHQRSQGSGHHLRQTEARRHEGWTGRFPVRHVREVLQCVYYMGSQGNAPLTVDDDLMKPGMHK